MQALQLKVRGTKHFLVFKRVYFQQVWSISLRLYVGWTHQLTHSNKLIRLSYFESRVVPPTVLKQHIFLTKFVSQPWFSFYIDTAANIWPLRGVFIISSSSILVMTACIETARKGSYILSCFTILSTTFYPCAIVLKSPLGPTNMANHIQLSSRDDFFKGSLRCSWCTVHLHTSTKKKRSALLQDTNLRFFSKYVHPHVFYLWLMIREEGNSVEFMLILLSLIWTFMLLLSFYCFPLLPKHYFQQNSA